MLACSRALFVAVMVCDAAEPTWQGPVLLSAVAADRDGERGVTAGDTVTLVFDRPTRFSSNTAVNSTQVRMHGLILFTVFLD